MRKYALLWILALSILVLCFLPRPAEAYLDPGTGGAIFGSIWALIVPFFAMAAIFFGAMIRPVRLYVVSLFSKLLGGSKAESSETDEQEAADDLSDGDSSGESKHDQPRS